MKAFELIKITDVTKKEVGREEKGKTGAHMVKVLQLQIRKMLS